MFRRWNLFTAGALVSALGADLFRAVDLAVPGNILFHGLPFLLFFVFGSIGSRFRLKWNFPFVFFFTVLSFVLLVPGGSVLTRALISGAVAGFFTANVFASEEKPLSGLRTFALGMITGILPVFLRLESAVWFLPLHTVPALMSASESPGKPAGVFLKSVIFCMLVTAGCLVFFHVRNLPKAEDHPIVPVEFIWDFIRKYAPEKEMNAVILAGQYRNFPIPPDCFSELEFYGMTHESMPVSGELDLIVVIPGESELFNLGPEFFRRIKANLNSTGRVAVIFPGLNRLPPETRLQLRAAIRSAMKGTFRHITVPDRIPVILGYDYFTPGADEPKFVFQIAEPLLHTDEYTQRVAAASVAAETASPDNYCMEEICFNHVHPELFPARLRPLFNSVRFYFAGICALLLVFYLIFRFVTAYLRGAENAAFLRENMFCVFSAWFLLACGRVLPTTFSLLFGTLCAILGVVFGCVSRKISFKPGFVFSVIQILLPLGAWFLMYRTGDTLFPVLAFALSFLAGFCGGNMVCCTMENLPENVSPAQVFPASVFTAAAAALLWVGIGISSALPSCVLWILPAIAGISLKIRKP